MNFGGVESSRAVAPGLITGADASAWPRALSAQSPSHIIVNVVGLVFVNPRD